MEGGGDGRSEYKKGLWAVEEDKILMDYIRVHGKGKWNRIPKITGLKRSGKSCRLRWINYLSPGVKKGNFSEEEDDLIIRLHKLLGNRWSLIAGRVPGRTDNQVKNHWNTHLSKKLGVKKVKCKASGTTLSSSNDEPTSNCNDGGIGHVNVTDGDFQNSTVGVSSSQELMTSDCYNNSFWFSNDFSTLCSTPGLMGFLDEPLDFLWHDL